MIDVSCFPDAWQWAAPKQSALGLSTGAGATSRQGAGARAPRPCVAWLCGGWMWSHGPLLTQASSLVNMWTPALGVRGQAPLQLSFLPSGNKAAIAGAIEVLMLGMLFRNEGVCQSDSGFRFFSHKPINGPLAWCSSDRNLPSGKFPSAVLWEQERRCLHPGGASTLGHLHPGASPP